MDGVVDHSSKLLEFLSWEGLPSLLVSTHTTPLVGPAEVSKESLEASGGASSHTSEL